MWDQVDRDVMMASDGKELHTYVHSHTTIRGSMVRLTKYYCVYYLFPSDGGSVVVALAMGGSIHAFTVSGVAGLR